MSVTLALDVLRGAHPLSHARLVGRYDLGAPASTTKQAVHQWLRLPLGLLTAAAER